MTCPKCEAIVFGGHGCIRCGHVGQAAEPVPERLSERPTAPTATDPAAEADGAEPDGAKKRMVLIAGAVVAAVAVIAGGITVLFNAETAAQEAADAEALAFAESEPEPVVLDDTFCRRPEPITDAPAPTAEGPNQITAFEMDGLYWGSSSEFQGTYLSSIGNAKADSVYALCLGSIGSGRDQTCKGYSNNAKYVIAGMTHTVTIYELATADLVFEQEVKSIKNQCPQIIQEGDRGAQKVNRSQVTMAAAKFAYPAAYSGDHFGHDLDYLSPTWCSSPKAISRAGENAETNGLVMLGGESEAVVTVNTYDHDVATHVACIEFVRSSEEPFVCDYSKTDYFNVMPGAHKVTVVDLSTGLVLGSSEFEGKLGCPSTVFTGPGWNFPKNATVDSAAYEFINATMASQSVDSEAAE